MVQEVPIEMILGTIPICNEYLTQSEVSNIFDKEVVSLCVVSKFVAMVGSSKDVIMCNATICCTGGYKSG